MGIYVISFSHNSTLFIRKLQITVEEDLVTHKVVSPWKRQIRVSPEPTAPKEQLAYLSAC